MLPASRPPQQSVLRARQCATASTPFAARPPVPRVRKHRHAATVQAFQWPFGSNDTKSEGSGGSNKEGNGLLASIMAAAPRQPQRRGCKLAAAEAPEGLKLATFAGGCFWGLELALQRVPGVVRTCVGYTGGSQVHPTYEEVCMGWTGHTEAVQVTYNPEEVSFAELMDVFLERTDVTTLNRQGNDRGTQYRSAVYFHDDEQRDTAAAKFREVDEKLSKGPSGWFNKRVVAELEPANDFWVAEAYHQQYLARGGRFGLPQRADKGCKDPIRCYG